MLSSSADRGVTGEQQILRDELLDKLASAVDLADANIAAGIALHEFEN